MTETEWPWQYNFPPFFTIQPHADTRVKQLNAWENLILQYMQNKKMYTIDIRDAHTSELFSNPSINRKLTQESLLIILEEMEKNGKAEPRDKSKTVWDIYWHSLEEWGNKIYSWVCDNGLTNSVCTLFELREGDDTVNQDFHGLDNNILMKALRKLEESHKCEVMEFDDNQGVKFF